MELDMGRDHDNESKSRSRSRSHSHSLEARDGRSRSRYRTRSRSRSRSHDRDYYYERERHSRSRSDEESNSLRAYWKPVKDDPSNFEAWTQLLHYIEQLDETKAAREAYDEFLKRYPFCYGYWRKYAEFERRHKHYERSVKVYEYGVSAIQLSVDLWLHYIAFIREIVQHQENSIEKTRVLYNRALEACGLEFRSDKLWEEYISWELNNNEPNRVGLLYDQLLSIPTLMYSNHFGRYQAFVNSNEPDQVVNQEEYNEILKKAQEDLKKAQPTELYIEEEFIDESPPDCIPENGEEPPRKVIFRRKHSEDALRIMRQEIIERRRKKHVANEREVSRRWPFEENIKRSYFHVKPLETAQLRNWHDYLNFEIENGDTHRTIILFERCVIACAMYEEMWTKVGCSTFFADT
ncbi:hypothetical protein AB6A40_009886 [Gnathostoma spinigerum]|uniref:Pre-mRNA-processing factor 39 n=1 Tax=Gnathostoma spinigerum TaxID=75299 RepID=A0ABD6F1G0_9BILA